ncbi:MAG: SiaB family protein kinase [Bacteroidia bacterium]|nr:SiaB family protein kinase [Bacteroidia bacterium]
METLTATREMVDVFDIYNKMERNNILLSFKGEITSDLLTSILQIMENKMENMQEEPKMKKKVYNVLVECLQNLYHHLDDSSNFTGDNNRSAIFMIGKLDGKYSIFTGNYILNENINGLRRRLDEVNALSKEELKEYYKKVLNNGEMSLKGGGGLGMIDIARKTGEKLEYEFLEIDNKVSFFTLNIKVSQQN